MKSTKKTENMIERNIKRDGDSEKHKKKSDNEMKILQDYIAVYQYVLRKKIRNITQIVRLG